MSYKRTNSKYTEQKNSTIRFNIIGALEELATFSGIDIYTIKTTSPYSIELEGITSQKIAVEMKKLIDYGMVVKETSKGKTKYMLRSTYNDLIESGDIENGQFGYGDYRDHKPKDDYNEEEMCRRISFSINRTKYEDMW